MSAMQQTLKTLREKGGLTQEAMAQQLFVTRQAVSRWENGETTPNIETLKLISRVFGVSIDDLLGEDRNKYCQCCTYPLDNLDEFGTNEDGTWNDDYCIYCHKDGEWVDPHLTIQDVIKHTIPYMTAPTATEDEIHEVHKRLAEWLPTLKRWKDR